MGEKVKADIIDLELIIDIFVHKKYESSWFGNHQNHEVDLHLLDISTTP